MSKNQLKGQDLEYANKFLGKFGEAILSDIESEAKKIQTDLRVGALDANNITKYINKSSECGKFLLGIVVENMHAHMKDHQGDEPPTVQ